MAIRLLRKRRTRSAVRITQLIKMQLSRLERLTVSVVNWCRPSLSQEEEEEEEQEEEQKRIFQRLMDFLMTG